MMAHVLRVRMIGKSEDTGIVPDILNLHRRVVTSGQSQELADCHGRVKSVKSAKTQSREPIP